MLLEMIGDMLGGTPTDKLNVLKVYTDKDEQLKLLIGMMYDPLIKFGVTIPHNEYIIIHSVLVEDDIYDGNKLMKLLTDLSSGRIKGSNAKKEAVWDYIHNGGTHLLLFLRRSLDLGIGLKSIKKLGLIDNYSVQKGILLTDFSKINFPICADWKYNGARLTVQVSPAGVVCKLLKGRVIKIPLLEQILATRSPSTEYVIDGEIIYNGGITEADRLVVNGMITSATSMDEPLPFGNLEFKVYDLLRLEYFKVCKVDKTLTFKVRRSTLINLLNVIDHEQITLVDSREISSVGALEELMKYTKEQNGEGLMLKPYIGYYAYTKNSQWLKIKNMEPADLEVIGYTEHKRDANLIGSLRCKGFIKGIQVIVNVGSGLNDLDRAITIDSYIGKILEVTYLDVLANKDGSYSLSNPRFNKVNASDLLITYIRDDTTNINN